MTGCTRNTLAALRVRVMWRTGAKGKDSTYYKTTAMNFRMLLNLSGPGAKTIFYFLLLQPSNEIVSVGRRWEGQLLTRATKVPA